MPEARPTNGEDPGAVFARAEAAVAAGNTDLSSLGYWRVLARVKRDPALIERWADTAGRIDTAAFRRGVRLRVPVAAGNGMLVLGTVAGVAAAAIGRSSSSPTLAGLGLVAAGAIWSVSVHSLAHWVVGRIAGIRFTDYFLAGSPLPRPGVKTDYATYLRADPNARAWMHASGAIATKLAPFAALAVYPGSHAAPWSAWALLGLGVLQITTDVLFSVRSSDWKKFRRERAVARALHAP
jgi:hypothetical protein